MYIHSYQIHNVLNVYRKQLSQSPSTNGNEPATATKGDRVEVAFQEQRQSLIDKVSAEIVNRMAQAGPQKNVESALARHLARTSGNNNERVQYREIEFSYNAIDEHNRKISNTLPVEKFSPLAGGVNTDALNSAE